MSKIFFKVGWLKPGTLFRTSAVVSGAADDSSAYVSDPSVLTVSSTADDSSAGVSVHSVVPVSTSIFSFTHEATYDICGKIL